MAWPIQAFLSLEAASGVVLFGCAAAALAWSNLGGAGSYHALFQRDLALPLGEHTLRFTVRQVVNDGLMTVFFFLVGMEIKLELALGELRTAARALLPAVAALGGMVVPALVYAAFNRSGPGSQGWGIPMATDIAFCVGCLTLLKRRVPHALVVFVTALAIFDDIGGILVIAIFYGQGLSAGWLLAAAATTSALAIMGRRHVRSGTAYVLVGALLWLALHHAGIHPTIAGVVTGLAVPSRSPAGLEVLEPPLTRFVSALHPWVAFGIVPLFALANSGVDLSRLQPAQLTGGVALGAGLGLALGKPLGIFAFTYLATRLGLGVVPGGASLVKLLGASIVAGIGFTVALFIGGLAFSGDEGLLEEAKFGILAGSLLAGVVGALVLRATRADEGGTPLT